MKQTSKLIGCLVILLCLTVPAQAIKGPPGVAETLHNLSSNATWNMQYYSSNVNEVCVFCHTPHGGLLDGPLWNHSMPGVNSFTHYNSATLSGYLQGQFSRPINDESLLCMACHDGSVAVNHIINTPNSIGSDPVITWFKGDGSPVQMVGYPDRVGARIGASLTNPEGGVGDLSDDHPISFSYSKVLGDVKYLSGSGVGELHDIASALASGVRFFGSDNQVECSSCHDPHVNYEGIAGGDEDYRPFLITPNTGSALCFACHNK